MTPVLSEAAETSPCETLISSRAESFLYRLAGRYLTFTVCVACALAVFIYFLVPQSMADPDIWWHLRNAEWQLHAHAFLRQDVFSYSARGGQWIDHEWLAELPFYLGWRILSAGGVYAVTLFTVEVIFLGVFYLAYRRSGSSIAALAVSAAGALLSTISFGPRTLLFGWISLVVELILLERFRKGQKGIRFLPVLFALWINLHGSWLIGLALFAVYIVSGWHGFHFGAICNPAWSVKQRRQLLFAAGMSAVALFLNPYGWKLIAYPFDLALRQRLNVASIEEWRTLDFHSLRGQVLFAFLAITFLLQLVRRKTWSLCDLSFIVIGVYAAFVYSRFLFLAALLIMPPAGLLLARDHTGARGRSQRPWANLLLLGMLVPLIASRLPSRPAIERSGEDRFPIRAAAYLQDFYSRGNVFNDFLWGGFLIWHSRQTPVLIDSRVDIYERSGVFQDYLNAVQLNDTFRIFEKYRVRYVVFRNNTPLIYLLRRTAGWKIDYEDATTIVLERTK